jgi:hypothetical protein
MRERELQVLTAGLEQWLRRKVRAGALLEYPTYYPPMAEIGRRPEKYARTLLAEFDNPELSRYPLAIIEDARDFRLWIESQPRPTRSSIGSRWREAQQYDETIRGGDEIGRTLRGIADLVPARNLIEDLGPTETGGRRIRALVSLSQQNPFGLCSSVLGVTLVAVGAIWLLQLILQREFARATVVAVSFGSVLGLLVFVSTSFVQTRLARLFRKTPPIPSVFEVPERSFLSVGESRVRSAWSLPFGVRHRIQRCLHWALVIQAAVFLALLLTFTTLRAIGPADARDVFPLICSFVVLLVWFVAMRYRLKKSTQAFARDSNNARKPVRRASATNRVMDRWFDEGPE